MGRAFRFLVPGLLFVAFIQAGASGAPSQSRRPDYLPGSARFSLEDARFIVLPAEAGKRLSAAAEDLSELLEERTGAKLELLADTERRPKHAFYLKVDTGKPYHLSPGGFFIHRERLKIYIHGGSEEGVANGVYAFARRVLGARWYWPGERGFEWVGDAPDKFPEIRWREEPAYVMRTLGATESEFARRNRLARRYQFNHALADIFTPELFEEDPEVFAEINGRRRRPTGSRKFDPQPDFTHPRAVEYAADAALEHFAAHPESRSFSLSINDNVRFDTSADTSKAVTPLRYFRGRPDYTGLVFRFTSRVAERVFEDPAVRSTPSGEARYLTALSYYWTEPAPNFELHPRVMPIMTSDRAQWHDPEYRAQDKALIRRWSNSGAERLGTWDYYFGAPLPYPRQFNKWLVESLRYLNEEGVDVFYAQLPAFWGLDGAKAWLAAELLWDPGQDADALLNEYYTEFFGAAAGPVRRFYEIAEMHRDLVAGEADWIKYYKDESATELFPKHVLEGMRAQLKQAEAAVKDDSRRSERVAVVSEAFSLTEAYAAFHQARRALFAVTLAVFAEGENIEERKKERIVEILNARGELFLKKRSAYRELGEELLEDPLHRHVRHILGIAQSDPMPLALTAIASLGGEPEISGNGEYEGVTKAVTTWANDSENFHSKVENPELLHAGPPEPFNFLGPPVPSIDDWHFDFRPSENFALGAASVEEESTKGVRISGADACSVFRTFPVIAEQSYLLSSIVRWRASPDNRVFIRLTWRDRDGNRLRTDRPLRLPTGERKRKQPVLAPVSAPANAYTVRVYFTVSRQYEGDFFEILEVDFGLLK
ncbi:MAG: DUF4838 domain-containing protein [Opitutales bacterium]